MPNKFRFNKIDHPLIIVSTILTIIVILFSIFALGSLPETSAPRMFSDSQPALPVDLTGTWKTETHETVGFTAKIAAGFIEIETSNDDTRMSYWYGSFDNSPVEGQGYESIAQPSEKIYLSSSKTKSFVYRDGKISFEFSAFGVTRIVELHRA